QRPRVVGDAGPAGRPAARQPLARHPQAVTAVSPSQPLARRRHSPPLTRSAPPLKGVDGTLPTLWGRQTYIDLGQRSRGPARSAAFGFFVVDAGGVLLQGFLAPDYGLLGRVPARRAERIPVPDPGQPVAELHQVDLVLL